MWRALPWVACAACSSEAAQDPTSAQRAAADALAPFDFEKPKSVVALPKALREISGMAALDDERVFCVQDEKGLLYEARLSDGEILAQTRLLPDGDYEGIARSDAAWFFARSDGVVVRVHAAEQGWFPPEEFVVALPQKDLEAIALDPKADGREPRLLLAGKEPPEGDKNERDLRYVHAASLEDLSLAKEPMLALSRKEIRARAAELAAKAGTGAKAESAPKPKLELHISEIAVRPATGDVWILSGPDRTVLAVDRTGALLYWRQFEESLLPQPEALAFLPCGDLVIASEGKGGPAKLVRFALRR